MAEGLYGALTRGGAEPDSELAAAMDALSWAAVLRLAELTALVVRMQPGGREQLLRAVREVAGIVESGDLERAMAFYPVAAEVLAHQAGHVAEDQLASGLDDGQAAAALGVRLRAWEAMCCELRTGAYEIRPGK